MLTSGQEYDCPTLQYVRRSDLVWQSVALWCVGLHLLSAIDIASSGVERITRGTCLQLTDSTSTPQQVVGDGPVWECARLQGHGSQVGADPVGEAPGHETRIRGALSLLVEVDQVRLSNMA